MMPAAFDYRRPQRLDEALALLAQYGADGCVLAGGQSLLPLLKLRAVAPKVVLDIGRLGELKTIGLDGSTCNVGALVTQARLIDSQELRSGLPFFGGDLVLSDPLVRKRGTFGGALAYADPASDWTAVALALDAQMHISWVNGTRQLPIGEFLLDPFSTALSPTELLTHVTLSVPKGQTRMAYRKMRHPASGFALVGVAVVLCRDENGSCSHCRVAITGAASKAVRAKASEAVMQGQRLAPELIEAAAAQAVEGIDLSSDLHAGRAYRAQLVRTYVKRALSEAAAA